MDTPRYDLVHITRIIDRNKKFVLVITFICLLIGLVFHFFRIKRYEAEAAFFVSNPLYLDRSSMFTASESRYLDYFGDEDDIDRVMALAESDSVIVTVIKNTGLDKSWNFNMDDPYWRNEAKKEFKEYVNVKRTAYTLLQVFFTHKDAAMSSSVANEMVTQIENGYRSFYITRRATAAASVRGKLSELDSSINSLTDTLASLREASGIMDVLSPARLNLVTSNVKGNGGKGMGRYVEVIQNFEAVKDQLVADRAKYVSLLNQYSAGMGENDVPLFHSISRARPPVDPAGPSMGIILAASLMIGLFFSILYLLLTNYYKEVVVVKA